MMGSKEFIQFAKEQVADYFNGRADKTDKNGHIETGDGVDDKYVKTIQNQKPLLTTTVSDCIYY